MAARFKGCLERLESDEEVRASHVREIEPVFSDGSRQLYVRPDNRTRWFEPQAPIDATREVAAQAATTQGPAGTGGNPAVLPPTGRDAVSATPSLTEAPGGIDFSSLELRYLADVSTEKTRAVGYAFKALPSRGKRRAGSGLHAARSASDAFFVWLALQPQRFTVNLNPNEPDRIIDAELGRTDAGRVLLEADLRMKKTVGRLIHPDTRLGARYWREMGRIHGDRSACLGFRQWIVPAKATVHENRGELYILSAPLSVMLESDYVGLRRGGRLGGSCAGQPHGLHERSEALFRRLILPRVQHAVRHGREYAALRRVYLSRVAAEWYRRRAARRGSAFTDLIDRGNVDRWAPRRRWTPRDVFRRYMRSITEGEFKVRRRTRHGNMIFQRTVVYGGVDFTTIPRENLSTSQLRSKRPALPASIVRALGRPVTDDHRGEVWLGGTSFDRASAVRDPEFSGSRGGEAEDEHGQPGSGLIAAIAIFAAAAGLCVLLPILALVLLLRLAKTSLQRR